MLSLYFLHATKCQDCNVITSWGGGWCPGESTALQLCWLFCISQATGAVVGQGYLSSGMIKHPTTLDLAFSFIDQSLQKESMLLMSLRILITVMNWVFYVTVTKSELYRNCRAANSPEEQQTQ